MAKISIIEHAQAFSCTRKLLSVTIQGNITVMRFRNDISSSSYACQSLYDIGTGLRIMSSDYKHTSNLDLNPFDHLLDLLKSLKV